MRREILLFIIGNLPGGAVAIPADSGGAPGAAGGGITVAVGLHRSEIGERVLGGGRDEEEAASETEVDEGGRSGRREVRADQEEAPRIEASHCLRGGSVP